MIYAWRAWRLWPQLPVTSVVAGETIGEYWLRTQTTDRFVHALAPIGVVGCTWRHDGPTVAECRRGGWASGYPIHDPSLTVPVPGCTCGLWGTSKPDLPLSYVIDALHVGGSPMALGVVGMWGTMIRHRDGYRAAMARPVAIAPVLENLPYQRLAERYDIPVFPTVKALGEEFKIL
jgi:hypothetical protein